MGAISLKAITRVRSSVKSLDESSVVLRMADSGDVLNPEKEVPSGSAIELTVTVVNAVAATPLSCQLRWVVESVGDISADRIDETSAFERVEGRGGICCQFSLLAPGKPNTRSRSPPSWTMETRY
jgi:hypothetical protein